MYNFQNYKNKLKSLKKRFLLSNFLQNSSISNLKHDDITISIRYQLNFQYFRRVAFEFRFRGLLFLR